MMVAVPALMPVTLPSSTFATDMSLHDHVTSLFVASSGDTVATSVSLSPTASVRELLSSFTPVTFTSAAVTVTLQVAVLPPSFVVTVTVASPAAFASTLPLSSTVATSGLSELQLTLLSVASEGFTVAVRVLLSPTTSVRSVMSSVTPLTAMPFAFTVTLQEAVL